MSDEALTSRIRERARRIRQELGEPRGQDDDIWHQAERQIKQEEDTRPDPAPSRGGWTKPEGR